MSFSSGHGGGGFDANNSFSSSVLGVGGSSPLRTPGGNVFMTGPAPFEVPLPHGSSNIAAPNVADMAKMAHRSTPSARGGGYLSMGRPSPLKTPATVADAARYHHARSTSGSASRSYLGFTTAPPGGLSIRGEVAGSRYAPSSADGFRASALSTAERLAVTDAAQQASFGALVGLKQEVMQKDSQLFKALSSSESARQGKAQAEAALRFRDESMRMELERLGGGRPSFTGTGAGTFRGTENTPPNVGPWSQTPGGSQAMGGGMGLPSPAPWGQVGAQMASLGEQVAAHEAKLERMQRGLLQVGASASVVCSTASREGSGSDGGGVPSPWREIIFGDDGGQQHPSTVQGGYDGGSIAGYTGLSGISGRMAPSTHPGEGHHTVPPSAPSTAAATPASHHYGVPQGSASSARRRDPRGASRAPSTAQGVEQQQQQQQRTPRTSTGTHALSVAPPPSQSQEPHDGSSGTSISLVEPRSRRNSMGGIQPPAPAPASRQSPEPKQERPPSGQVSRGSSFARPPSGRWPAGGAAPPPPSGARRASLGDVFNSNPSLTPFPAPAPAEAMAVGLGGGDTYSPRRRASAPAGLILPAGSAAHARRPHAGPSSVADGLMPFPEQDELGAVEDVATAAAEHTGRGTPLGASPEPSHHEGSTGGGGGGRLGPPQDNEVRHLRRELAEAQRLLSERTARRVKGSEPVPIEDPPRLSGSRTAGARRRTIDSTQPPWRQPKPSKWQLQRQAEVEQELERQREVRGRPLEPSMVERGAVAAAVEATNRLRETEAELARMRDAFESEVDAARADADAEVVRAEGDAAAAREACEAAQRDAAAARREAEIAARDAEVAKREAVLQAADSASTNASEAVRAIREAHEAVDAARAEADAARAEAEAAAAAGEAARAEGAREAEEARAELATARDRAREHAMGELGGKVEALVEQLEAARGETERVRLEGVRRAEEAESAARAEAEEAAKNAVASASGDLAVAEEARAVLEKEIAEAKEALEARGKELEAAEARWEAAASETQKKAAEERAADTERQTARLAAAELRAAAAEKESEEHRAKREEERRQAADEARTRARDAQAEVDDYKRQLDAVRWETKNELDSARREALEARAEARQVSEKVRIDSQSGERQAELMRDEADDAAQRAEAAQVKAESQLREAQMEVSSARKEVERIKTDMDDRDSQYKVLEQLQEETFKQANEAEQRAAALEAVVADRDRDLAGLDEQLLHHRGLMAEHEALAAACQEAAGVAETRAFEAEDRLQHHARCVAACVAQLKSVRAFVGHRLAGETISISDVMSTEAEVLNDLLDSPTRKPTPSRAPPTTPGRGSGMTTPRGTPARPPAAPKVTTPRTVVAGARKTAGVWPPSPGVGAASASPVAEEPDREAERATESLRKVVAELRGLMEQHLSDSIGDSCQVQ